MMRVASRDLRNHTAEVLRQVAEGARVTVTVNGTPVAEISPVRGTRRASMSKSELVVLLASHQADPGLRDDLAALAGETTDDLDSLR
jgi:prevent-host-death family protein